ncbi:MAG: hypothetical protein LBT59_07500 [Clostridiales bacterium]|nr:hypothetical protein [Clostridiales bacterium]
MNEEKFDLKVFCDIMADCGLTRKLLISDIFIGIFDSKATLSRFGKLNTNVSIQTIKNAYNSRDELADRLADAFINYDTDQDQNLQGNYSVLVLRLKDARLQSKLNIVEPGQLPADIDERKGIYKTLLAAVLKEALATTWEKAAEINSSKMKPGNRLSESINIGLSKTITGIPANSELTPKSDTTSVINGISDLNEEETIKAFNALIENIHHGAMDEYKKEIMLQLVKDNLWSNFRFRFKHVHIENYKRIDEISISQDNCTMTKHVAYEFNLISDEIKYLEHSVDTSMVYNGDITDILDINTYVRTNDRLKIFEFTYSHIEILINGKKVDDVFRYFSVDTNPRYFSIGSCLSTSIVLDDLLQRYDDKSVYINVNYEMKCSPISTSYFYEKMGLYYSVKNYSYTCVLSPDTSKDWVLTIFPEQRNAEDIMSDRSDRGSSIHMPDWAPPGRNALYMLEYEGQLEFK